MLVKKNFSAEIPYIYKFKTKGLLWNRHPYRKARKILLTKQRQTKFRAYVEESFN